MRYITLTWERVNEDAILDNNGGRLGFQTLQNDVPFCDPFAVVQPRCRMASKNVRIGENPFARLPDYGPKLYTTQSPGYRSASSFVDFSNFHVSPLRALYDFVTDVRVIRGCFR